MLLSGFLLLFGLCLGVLRGFFLRGQTLLFQFFQALLFRRLLLLQLFSLLLRLLLALLFCTLCITALLLLAIVLLYHRPWIDHHGPDHGTITAAACTTHFSIFVQRTPNQQGNQ
ncbi:hypothetical protein D3C81_2036260 [compost metagenome]